MRVDAYEFCRVTIDGMRYERDMIVERVSGGRAQRVVRELWALGEGLYAVNAKPDLVANVARAVAEGLRARSPWA